MAKKLAVAEILSASVSNLNTPSMQVVEIPLDKLLDNEGNFFSVKDVQELADDIAMRGLENPLTVCEAGDGNYRIVAGHRRRKALEQHGARSAPCFVKAYADADSEEVALIQSNLTARELTYYEKMLAVVRLEEALRRMKENGVELHGRLRDHLAEKSGESASAVHRMTFIYKHLSPELMEGLRQEKINESIAYELAGSPKKVQKEFEQRLARGEMFRAQDVKKLRENPPVDDAALDTFLLEHIVCGYSTELYRVLHDNNNPAIMLVHPVKQALHFWGSTGHWGDDTQYDIDGKEFRISKPFRAVLSWSQIVSRLRDMVQDGKIVPSEEPEPTPEEQAMQEFSDGLQKAVQENVPQSSAPTIPEKDFKVLDQMIAASKQMPDRHCVTGLSKYGTCGSAQCCDEPYECCIACPKDCNGRCGWLPKAAPQPAPIWHPYPAERPTEGQTVLTCKDHRDAGRSYSALLYRDGCWYLPELPDCQMRVDVRWWSAELAPESEGSE